MDITNLSVKLTIFVEQDLKLRNPCCRQSRRCYVLISNSSFNILSKVFITRLVSDIGR